MAKHRVKGPPALAVHPGDLMCEILEDHAKLTVTEAARRMEVSRQALHTVLSGVGAVSADLALRFARLVGGTPELYLHMQALYDLQEARGRLEETLARIEPVPAP